jgi:hypothetical protein
MQVLSNGSLWQRSFFINALKAPTYYNDLTKKRCYKSFFFPLYFDALDSIVICYLNKYNLSKFTALNMTKKSIDGQNLLKI